MRRAGLLSALLALPFLAGCGGGRDYCATVRQHQSELGSLAHAGSSTGALRALPILEELEGRSPGDVRGDYQLVVDRIRALQQALDDAGVDPASYDPKHPPAGLDPAERRRIRDAAAHLAAADTVQALASVQQEVLDVCHTPLEI